jgi:hypothetical protein
VFSSLTSETAKVSHTSMPQLLLTEHTQPSL